MSGDHRRTILIIDEDAASARAVREVLEEAGYRVATRPTVATATSDLAWCHPDVIVLDDADVGSNLPVVVPLLRGPEQSRLIVLHSSTPPSQLVPLAARVGADGYADKKAGVFRLVQELRRVMEEPTQRNSITSYRVPKRSEPIARAPKISVSTPPAESVAPDRSGTFAAVTAPGKQRMPRLLLIDDELSILSAFRRLLQREGFICDYVLSGREALRRIRSSEPPDVVVSDVIMREPNGSDVFREMCAEDPRWERRYVFVTGDPITARPLIRHTSENVTILAKPVSSQQLVTAIRSRLAVAS